MYLKSMRCATHDLNFFLLLSQCQLHLLAISFCFTLISSSSPCCSHSLFSLIPLFYLSHFYLFLLFTNMYYLAFLPRWDLISIPTFYSPSSALMPFLAPPPIPARITLYPHPYLQSSYPLCHSQAFASQCLFCVRHLGISIEKVNPYGGAIALGHPLGCSGESQ